MNIDEEVNKLNEWLDDISLSEGTNLQCASYELANDESLRLLEEDCEVFYNESIYKSSPGISIYIKCYRALSFLLTGDRNCFLITGKVIFGEDMHCIGYIRNDQLSNIITKFESINIKELEDNFDPRIFLKKKLYPHIWRMVTKEVWFKALINNYYKLIDFYRKARDEKSNIITYLTGFNLDCSAWWDADGDCQNCDLGIDCDVANNYGEWEIPN